MIDPLQSVHPDADTLSAFAENALPAHDREITLAHLARCAECRHLVKLAMPPFEELLPIAVVPARRSFTAWRWLFAAASVAAAVPLIAVLIHPVHRDSTPAVTIAKVEPAPQPLIFAPATPAAPAVAAPAPVPAPPAQRPPVLAKVAPPLSGSVAKAEPEPARPEGQATAPPVSLNQSFVAAAPAPVAPQSVNGSPASASPRARQDATPLAAMQRQYSLQKVAPPPAAAESADISVNAAAADIITTQASEVVSLLPDLPSHLATASSYTSGPRTLAADTAGTLYLRKKTGAHWSRIKPSWSGTVLTVSAAPANSTALFSLQTTTGEHWLSRDGNHWSREQS